LLFSFSALSLSNNPLVYDLLEDYRGIEEEDNYQQLINKLLDAYRLSSSSTVDFDGTLLTFGTSGWYKDIKFLLDARQSKVRITDKNGKFICEVEKNYYTPTKKTSSGKADNIRVLLGVKK